MTPADIVAEEGRYAVLSEEDGDAYVHDLNDGSDGWPRDAHRAIGSREMALAFVGRWSGTKPVMVLDDGAHEAAVEAARREGAEAALHDARRALLDLADDFAGEHAAGLRHAVRCVYDMIQATIEAAKGQAK